MADGLPSGVVQLLVCTTCRLPDTDPAGDPAAPRPGAGLADRLTAEAPAGVQVVPVECLSNCKRGCTVALRGPGRWTYVYGDLDPDQHVPTILDGTALYRDTPDGLVPWRARPEHFRKHCIARIPPLEAPHG